MKDDLDVANGIKIGITLGIIGWVFIIWAIIKIF